MRPVGGWLADRIGGAQVLSWVFGGVAVFALAADVAVDGAVHRRRAGVRGAARPGQRRGVQARARAFSQGHRHRHRPRRRARRTRRILPAAAARRVSRHARRAVAGIPAAVRDGARAALSRISACFTRPMSRGAQSLPPAARRPLERARAGAWAALVDLRAGRRDRRRLAQPRALRRGARRLHVCDALRGVRHHLPLCDVAQPAADAHVLAARLAGVLRARRASAPNAAHARPAGAGRVRRESLHLPRGRLRGLAHWLIMWGCLLAAAITFPLVWGWIHFETVPGDLHRYRTFVFGIPVQDFPVDSASPSSSFTGWSGRRSWSSPA